MNFDELVKENSNPIDWLDSLHLQLWHLELSELQIRLHALWPNVKLGNIEAMDEYEYLCELIATEYIG